MSIRMLPANHLLLVENGLQEFDDEGAVLAIIDDHSAAADQPEPQLVAIALPKGDPTGLERELGRWAPRIREHTLTDAYEAMHEAMRRLGHTKTDIEQILDHTRELVEQERVPASWTAWGAVPPGSLSAFGDGSWLLRWPTGDQSSRLDASRFTPRELEDVGGPEFTFNPSRPSAPWLKVYRTGLTAEQIGALVTIDRRAGQPLRPGESPADALARLFPVET